MYQTTKMFLITLVAIIINVFFIITVKADGNIVAVHDEIRTESTILSRYHVPGTTQTISGYDTELGVDPICWVSYGHIGNGTDAFKSDLFPEFTLDGTVQLQQSCPIGNTLTSTFKDSTKSKLPYRTGTFYNYMLDVKLNITSLNGTNLVSNDEYGPAAAVAVQVVLCELGKIGFCTPFVHEATNARLDQAGKVPKGDRHGDTHIHSGYKYIPISSSEQQMYVSENNTIIEFEMSVPILVNKPGHFFAIAAVHFFLTDDSGNVFTRYDMANSISENDKLISFQEPAILLIVPLWVRVISYVIIAFVAIIIAFLLLQTIIHRNNRIIKLCQGPFLIVFLLAALIATIASFLFNPLNDIYCRVSMPIIMISLQLLYAVTAGRLWRINAVISPLLVKTLQQERSVTQKILSCFRKIINSNYDSRQPTKLRKQVTTARLAGIVATLTIPQVIIQVLQLTIQPAQLDVHWNDEMSKGRSTCSCGEATIHSLAFYGYLYFFFTVVGLMIVAQATRMLPSLFNETRVIFESTMTSLVLLFLGVGIISATNDPSTSPAVCYIVSVAVCLSITLLTSYRIMMPKFRLIWKGETVIVSQLVSDHKASVVKENQSIMSNRERLSLMFGFSLRRSSKEEDTTERNTASTRSAVRSDSQEVIRDLQVYNTGIAAAGANPRQQVLSNRTDLSSSASDYVVETSPDEAAERRDTVSELKCVSSLCRPSSRRVSEVANNNNNNRIVIDTKRTPARRLVLKMLDMQEKLSSLNNRIMSGLAVTEEDWMVLRETSHRFGLTFSDEVRFAWERGNRPGGNAVASYEDSRLQQQLQNDLESPIIETTEHDVTSNDDEIESFKDEMQESFRKEESIKQTQSYSTEGDDDNGYYRVDI